MIVAIYGALVALAWLFIGAGLTLTVNLWGMKGPNWLSAFIVVSTVAALMASTALLGLRVAKEHK